MGLVGYENCVFSAPNPNRLGVAPNPEIGWPAQVILSLGRSIRRQSSTQKQCILPHRSQEADPIRGHFGARNGASLESRAVMSVLQLNGIVLSPPFVELLSMRIAVH